MNAFRVFAASMLAAALTLSIGAPSARAQGGPKYATVTGKKVPVYSKPAETSPVVTTVKRGTYLEVGGIRGQWVKVRTESGEVGFVMKSAVVPGKKELSDGGGGGNGGGGGGGGGGRRGGGGPTVEGRTGILSKAGLLFAGNSYAFKASSGGSSFSRDVPMSTAYAGYFAEADWWFIEMAGAHIRLSQAFGSMTTELSPPINKRVDRIPTNINQIQADVMGRFFFGDDGASPSVNGKLGFHMHEMRIDPVEKDGEPIFLVSQSYSGPVLGLGADIPLGSPSFGLRAGLEYWLAASLKEGSGNASGKPKGATGFGVAAGTYFNFSDTSGLDVGVEYHSFQGSFSGSGSRFYQGIENAKTTDNYVLFSVNGTFRF